MNKYSYSNKTSIKSVRFDSPNARKNVPINRKNSVKLSFLRVDLIDDEYISLSFIVLEDRLLLKMIFYLLSTFYHPNLIRRKQISNAIEWLVG